MSGAPGLPGGLLGTMASAVPPGGAPMAPPGAGAVAAATPVPNDAVARAQKVLADQKAGEQSQNSKTMMAFAQQLLNASQAPKFTPMQLAPDNTGPMRPLPLNLPRFGQLS
jgi:hypothetical protein